GREITEERKIRLLFQKFRQLKVFKCACEKVGLRGFVIQSTQAKSLENEASGKKILDKFADVSQSLNGIELLIIVKAKAGDLAGAINLLNARYLQDRSEASNILGQYLDAENLTVKKQVNQSLREILRGGLFFFIPTFLFLLAASFIFYRILRKFIFVPILDLSATAHKVKVGDFTARASKIYSDEFGELATTFNDMTLQLDTLYKNLKKQIKEGEVKNLKLAEANKKLIELDQQKSDFLSIAAHQLRTPLSGIKWTLSMLLSGDLGTLNDDQKTFLMKSYESNNRMVTLVNDMLVADRIQLGKVQYGFKYINLIDLMDNILFEINPVASRRNISIKYKNRFADLPHVYTDPETMRVVLQNLLENAIKYTIEGGKIEIDVSRKGEYLLVSISDNGIGIPEDQVKNVFTRFFRASNAVKKETDGSGLGLYITKTMVEKNGGKIWFNTVLNKGTNFYFTVPLQDKH
ncbi:MAG: Integral membrane sensor signal transduction histidine kinase, partial [Parcubacteria group bacterium GW2011_GWF2_42_7]